MAYLKSSLDEKKAKEIVLSIGHNCDRSREIVEKIEKYKENGEYIGATLGIYAYDRKMIPYINSELNKNYNLDNGIYVAEVIRNSPADKAQIKSGDIIITIDEKEINKMSELRRIIYEKNVGDIINVKYMRNGKISQKEITLAKKY